VVNILGKAIRDEQFRFALSVEEVGLLIDQLPNHEVQLSRSGDPSSPIADYTAEQTIMPTKILRVAPIEGGAVSFAINYELNAGVGGISDNKGRPVNNAQVVAQRGEFVVMRELMRTSIPSLVSWSHMLEISMRNRIEQTCKK